MKRVILAGAIYIVATASSTYAHHSHPLVYDWCKTLTIEGNVERVEYKDPHSHLLLRLDNGTLWTVDWNPLGGLRNSGRLDPAQKALAFGARIAVTGAPIRTLAEMRQHFPDYNTEPNPNTIDPASMRRVDDSWSRPVNSQGPQPAGNPGAGLCEVYERLTSAKASSRR
jgi:Family of unknown function (DUF6152)